VLDVAQELGVLAVVGGGDSKRALVAIELVAVTNATTSAQPG